MGLSKAEKAYYGHRTPLPSAPGTPSFTQGILSELRPTGIPTLTVMAVVADLHRSFPACVRVALDRNDYIPQLRICQ